MTSTSAPPIAKCTHADAASEGGGQRGKFIGQEELRTKSVRHCFFAADFFAEPFAPGALPLTRPLATPSSTRSRWLFETVRRAGIRLS
jgi:hypothetical protein